MSQGLTERIIACAIGALRILGPGLLESSDEETLCHEIDLRGLPFERQKEVDVVCEDKSIKGRRIDLTVDGQVVFEIKAVKTLNDAFTSQALSYLI